MKAEEIEQFLQTLSGAQKILEDATALHQQVLGDHEKRQKKLGKAFRQVAESNAQLTQMLAQHEERLDESDEKHADADGRLNALTTTQIDDEERRKKLEEAFRQVAETNQMAVQMIAQHEERLDESDARRADADERLNALIAAQIKTEEKFAALAEAQTRLAEAQARTDEQIRQLLHRDGNE